MNVLIFVMTLLMLLALMTYARLETFRNSQVFQIIFKDYMEKDERGYFNSKAHAVYTSIKVNTNEGNKGANAKAEGNPRLGILLLMDKSLRESKPQEWNQTKILLKNLLEVLYGQQPFYRQAIKKRYTIADDLINAITETADGLPKEKKLKTAADLANLKLEDPELNIFLYKILQGAAYREINGGGISEITPPIEAGNEEPEVDQSQEDSGVANEALEYKSIEGYYSLLDFITATSMPKVRVFLAPREILQSIFHDKQVVDMIIQSRKQYYRQVVNGADPKELSDGFKNEFERYKDSSVDDTSLNFTVTKTNPKYYE